MRIDFHWWTKTGSRTDDNRDWAGVGLREDDALCIVLDGSTAAPDSGEIARRITHELIDWFVDSNDKMTVESITAELRQIHMALSRQYRRGSASYMIVHVRSPNKALVLHAGDCLLGRFDENSAIKWLTRPHTLANISSDMPVTMIANLPARHRLTRSFRIREFMPPDATKIRIQRDLLIATDGFWADLSSGDQARFIEGHDISMAADGDDCSILRIRLTDGAGNTDERGTQQASDNLYVKTRC